MPNSGPVRNLGRHQRIDTRAIREEIRALRPAIQSQWAATHAAAERLWHSYAAMLDKAHAQPSGLVRRLVAGD